MQRKDNQNYSGNSNNDPLRGLGTKPVKRDQFSDKKNGPAPKPNDFNKKRTNYNSHIG